MRSAKMRDGKQSRLVTFGKDSIERIHESKIAANYCLLPQQMAMSSSLNHLKFSKNRRTILIGSTKENITN